MQTSSADSLELLFRPPLQQHLLTVQQLTLYLRKVQNLHDMRTIGAGHLTLWSRALEALLYLTFGINEQLAVSRRMR